MPLLRYLAFSWTGRAIVGLVVVAVVGGAVVAPRFGTSTARTEVRTAAVARGTVTQTVAVSGSVNASSQVRASFKPSGRIAEILVKVGDAVAIGQPLARLDPTDLQTAVKQAEASLLSAQAKYDTTIAGTTAEDIALAKNALDSAQITFDQTKKTTQTDVTTAQQALDKAKRALDDSKVSTANDLAAALQSLNKVKTNYATARANFASLSTAIKTDIGAYQDALIGARRLISTTISDLDAASQTNEVSGARTSLLAADLSLANAQSHASGTLQSALNDFLSAVSGIVAAAVVFDGAAIASSDTSSAASQYQIAQVAYSLAASRLGSAVDVPAAQVTSAQTSASAAQTSLSSGTTRSNVSFNGVRDDVNGIQTALTTEAQMSTSIKSKVTQAGTSVTTITDAVTGSYVSAQQSYVSAQTKAQTSVQSAQDAVTTAQQALGTAQDKATSSVSSQEISLKNAQINYQKSTASPKSSDVASALSSLQLSQISLDKAKAELDNATLRAPVAGVIASVANQIGEAPANPFAVIAVTATLVLHGTVGESDVAKLKLGQVATIAVDAVGTGTRLTGRVTALDPVATVQQGVPVYGIDVQVDIPDPAVRAGMTGTATIIVASKQDVLTVPNRAIRSQSGRRFVQVMRDGQVEEADATFGIANDSLTEVTGGLQEGDQVVLPQTTAAATTQQRQGGGFPGVPGAPFR